MRGFEFQSVMTVHGSEPVIEWYWIANDRRPPVAGLSLFHSLASCMADAERHQSGESAPRTVE